jgi:hypothetical protein
MIIALLNKSSRYVANSSLLVDMASAVSQQLSKHVAPAWGMVPWSCLFFNDEKSVPTGAYRLWLLNDADQADALGYHDQDPSGMPYGKVFVNPVIKSGGTDFVGPNSVSAVISHEACEIMGDPEVNAWRQMKDNRLTCQELCDAVEGDAYPITVGVKKIYVSNFLLPAWFDMAPSNGSKFDYMNKLKAPFTMTKNGYMIIMDGGDVSNIFGSKSAQEKYEKNTSKMHVASRGSKRKKEFKPTSKDIVIKEEAKPAEQEVKPAEKEAVQVKKARKARRAK